MAEGFAFSPDSNWQREFEDAFEFTETKDQLSALSSKSRATWRAPHPMDRLLCGDVGYGKTEVAMRAAFKALGDGKQVAVLAPTTVLAFQHFETFKRRFAAFPVRIEMLSRFRDTKEIAEVLEEPGRRQGGYRHRNASPAFARTSSSATWACWWWMKSSASASATRSASSSCKHNVDVLTMSATPIPRTLHMSLLGIARHVA